MRIFLCCIITVIFGIAASCSGNKKHSDSLQSQPDTLYMSVFPDVDSWPDIVTESNSHYSLTDTTGRTDDSKSAAFRLEVSIPDDMPDWIKSFINDNLRYELQEYMFYRENKITAFDIAKRPTKELPEHYFNEYRTRYRERSDSIGKEWGEPFPGDIYSYEHRVYPIWQSRDKKLITFRFHTFGDAGNVHGWEFDWFLTFDIDNKRILCRKDLFTDENFEKAMQNLGEQLSAYHQDKGWDAAIDIDTSVTAGSDTTLYEVYKGNLYPRPAITPDGVIFSYQTYLKGGNADGVLHFVQPYSTLIPKQK